MNEHECENCDIVIVGDKDRKLCFYCQMAADDKTAQAKTTAYEARISELEAENDTATHQIESLANQCQFQAERLVALDAENAELRKQCAAFHAEANDHYRASLAATATLDRLRDVVPSREHWMHCCQCGMIMTPRPTLDIQECPNCFAMLQEIPGKLIAILYPTPENDNDSTS